MRPLVSVIIPVFNVESYLERCLSSIAQNTYQNLEIICVNDGSTDNSLEIVKSFAKTDSRIVVLSKNNGGVSSARNEGLKAATGDFVVFIDSDDYINTHFFEVLLDAQEKNKADFVICGRKDVNDSTDFGIINSEFLTDSASGSVISINEFFSDHKLSIFCTGRLIRKDIIQNCSFLEELSYGEDTVFISQIWDANPELKCCILDFDMYYYYQRSDSASKTDDCKKQLKLLKILYEKGRSSNKVCFFSHIIRQALSLRYMAKYIYSDKLCVQSCNKLLHSGISFLLCSDMYTLAQKCYYVAAIQSPQIDRIHRLRHNPELRSAEQQK